MCVHISQKQTINFKGDDSSFSKWLPLKIILVIQFVLCIQVDVKSAFNFIIATILFPQYTPI